MIFLVNDTAATPEAGGVYSILEDFYNEVINNDSKNKWFFLLSGKYFRETDNVKIIVREDLKKSKLKRFIFECFSGKKFINNLNPDVFISLQNISTIGIKAKKKIVYLHQPIPFQKLVKFKFYKKEERNLSFHQQLVGSVIKYSLSKEKPFVIVQTQWMKKAVLSQVKLPKEKIYVAHPKVEIIERTKKSLNNRSFFYPASSYIYKNHRIIFEAANLLEREGINDFKIYLTLQKGQLPLRNNNIFYIGHLNRTEVFKYYEESILLFPSYIESFGLPLIEAALKGDIILTSKTEFSRELLNHYKNAYYFDYKNAGQLASLMKKVINGEIKADGSRLQVNENGESLLSSIKNLL
ncbi:glycosyltransferase [Limosilactobacillus reuteri subsp. suis]|uniref:glycosyltransferase n=1 Tax=Limosilactobacillus reuteri TaxID=1598 RepID=UPI003991D9AE